MAVSIPVITYVQAYQTGTAKDICAFVTATALVTGYEALIPISIQFSYASGDPTVDVYRSHDGGTTFETQPFLSTAIAKQPAARGRVSLKLYTGIYAIKIGTCGGNTQTWFMETQEHITAYSAA